MKKVWVVYSPSLEVLSAHSSREEALGSTTAGLYCSVGTLGAKEAAERILRLAGYTPYVRASDDDVYLGLKTGREVAGDGTDTEFDDCISAA
jgi:hypothetical protein